MSVRAKATPTALRAKYASTVNAKYLMDAITSVVKTKYAKTTNVYLAPVLVMANAVLASNAVTANAKSKRKTAVEKAPALQAKSANKVFALVG